MESGFKQFNRYLKRRRRKLTDVEIGVPRVFISYSHDSSEHAQHAKQNEEINRLLENITFPEMRRRESADVILAWSRVSVQPDRFDSLYLKLMNETRKLTDLQILFLESVGVDKVSGRQLRERLAKHGWRKSAPVFYQLAARLEDDKLIEGSYERRTIAGQPVRERYYRLTAHGKQAFVEALRFCEERVQNNPGFLGGAPGYV